MGDSGDRTEEVVEQFAAVLIRMEPIVNIGR